MAYGELFQREDKTELKEILFHQVCRALENIPLDDSVRERIEDIVNVIADKGVPEYLMALYLEDEKAAQFCEGCEDSPCCTKNDPVALTWKDVQKIAKGLKTTNKKVLKEYTLPYKNEYWPNIQYKIKNVLPCQWQDENHRCKIYAFRPDICMAYPIAPDKEDHTTIRMGVAKYCNVAFNMMKQDIIWSIIRKDIEVKHPDEYMVAIQKATGNLPSEEELQKMPQLQRWQLLLTANKTFMEMFGMSL